MKTGVVLLLCLVFGPIFETGALSEEISIVYIERPPYYYSENNRVKGILADLTQKIFDTAQVPHTWQSLPPKRIMHMFQDTHAKVCSPGWFMKPERRAFAVFTHAIYQQKPLALLILKSNRKAFTKHGDLSSLFKDRSMMMGTVATYRYSDYIDELIKQYHPMQLQVSSSPAQLVKMISAGRIDYMIISPVEVGSLLRKAGIAPDRFELYTFPDITAGNKRYLMCSKSVAVSTIDRLNTSIEQIVAPEIWSE